MDYSHARFPYPQPHPDADINSKPPHFFAEGDAGAAESALMDADMMQTDEGAQLRRPSYVNNTNPVISPADSHPWSTPFGLPVDPASSIASPHGEHQHGFMHDPAHFGHASQLQAWPFEHTSGQGTPANRMDFEQPSSGNLFDAPQYVHQHPDSSRGSFGHPQRRHTFNGGEEGFVPAPQVEAPMSPHCHQDWMTMVAQEAESKPQSRRMRDPTPARTGFVGDGVRKKNARIEIPPERSIPAIEAMLETEKDEEVLKQLKSQKRLLRNREAALASRQRKKKHTEELEVREKEYTRSLEAMHVQNAALQNECAQHEQNFHLLSQRLEEARRSVEAMQEQSRDLVLRHSEETASLRKRVRALMETNEVAPAMSTVPSSTGFAEFNADMGALNMNPDGWDDLFYTGDLQHDPLDEFDFDIKPEPVVQPSQLERREPIPPPPHPPPAATVPVSAQHVPEASSDQHVTQGMLFFLLLCGAFVASRPPGLASPDLPNVPAEIRAAAPKVLNNLLFDTHQGPTSSRASHLPSASEPGPSGTAAHGPAGQSRLDRLHHRVTTPSRRQEMDSVFSLTTAEYASIAHSDYEGQGHEPPHPPRSLPAPLVVSDSRPRRNLAERLANVPDGVEYASGLSSAEVYTRSLLWDQIPDDVIRQFQDLVLDHERLEAARRLRASGEEQQAQQGRGEEDVVDFKVDL